MEEPARRHFRLTVAGQVGRSWPRSINGARKPNNGHNVIDPPDSNGPRTARSSSPWMAGLAIQRDLRANSLSGYWLGQEEPVSASVYPSLAESAIALSLSARPRERGPSEAALEPWRERQRLQSALEPGDQGSKLVAMAS